MKLTKMTAENRTHDDEYRTQDAKYSIIKEHANNYWNVYAVNEDEEYFWHDCKLGFENAKACLENLIAHPETL